MRGAGRGEVNLRLFSPANVRAASTAKGYRCSLGLFDEVGFMKEPTYLIEESVKSSNLSVPDPLWFEFSTMSPDPGHHQRQRQSKALECLKDPSINPRLYPMVRVAEPTANIEDPQTAIQLNALFREGIAPESIIHQELRAALTDSSKMTIYARERCGWAGDYALRFVDRDDWLACAVPGGRKEIAQRMKGRPIFIGTDYSEVSDLSASVACSFEDDGTLLALPYHWIPSAAEGRLDALTRGLVSAWKQDGWLETLQAGEDMPLKVAQRSLEVLDLLREDIVIWGYDKWHAEEAAVYLRDAGWGKDGVIYVPQAGNLNSAIKKIANLTAHGKIAHPGDPVFDYCMLSAYKEPDTKDPDKERLVKIERGVASERIDGAVAFCTGGKAREDHESFRSRQPEKPPGWEQVTQPKIVGV